MEEDFPRGKRQKLDEEAVTNDHQKTKETEKELFPEACQPAKEKKKLKNLRKSALKEDETKGLSELASPGMLVLGCVSQVRDFELIVSLPNGLTGTVAITDICDAYTSLLEGLATEEQPEDSDVNVPSLDLLFHVGKLVRCKIVSMSTKGSKRSATLSLNPKDVNSEVKLLKSGMVLTGCIASCEDHGYVVDIGMKGTCAFLKRDDAQKYMEAFDDERGELFVGSYLHCMINTDDSLAFASGESRAVNVVVEPRRVHRSIVTENMKVKLQSILPGMVATATVTKVSKSAVSVKFLSYVGIIQQSHLQLALQKYEPQQQINVAVLFVNPTTKVILLSELTHLVTPDLAPLRLFGKLEVGRVVEEASVIKADPRCGVYLRLPEKLRGFASLSDMSEIAVKKMQSKFQKGSTWRCRVLGFDLVDRIVHVSLRRRVIDQKFFSYSDIQPASILPCTVQGLHPGGVSVNVAYGIYGLIPRYHLAEVLLKHPEKKFTPGKKLKCKVLSVDTAKSKLLLTHKKSLIESKLPAIASYMDCHSGLVIEGCVVSVKPNGLVVVFYNNVKGFAPRRELSDGGEEFPEKMFYVGQTVKCRVMTCDPVEEKLILSLRVKTRRTSTGNSTIPEDWIVGKITDCRVARVTAGGLDVELSPGNIRAFLPKSHLSDHRSNYDLLLGAYQHGDVIDRVMYIGKTDIAIVSKKASLLRALAEDNLMADVSLLKPGMLGVGTVKRKMPYGVFIDMLNGLTGLAPNKFLLDRRHPDPPSFYDEGQSVAVKITEVDQLKQRFLVSLRSVDVYHGDVDIGLQLLADYLAEYQLAFDRQKNAKDGNRHLVELSIGQIVKATVTKVTNDGVVCQLADSLKAFATTEHMPGVVLKVGDATDAVVLHIDLIADCVQLTFNKDVIKAIRNYKDNKFTQVRMGQVIKSEVQLITDDFALVMLKGHAAGQLAYLPAKRHLNDVFERHQYTVTQLNNIVVKRVEAGKIFGVLEIHDKTAIAADSGCAKPAGLPAVETVAMARVTKVYDLQLNVSVNGCAGRVHVTELADELEPGVNPVKKFQVGSEFSVKVIGYRTLKGHKYLPITHADRTQAVLECTAKPSKLTTLTNEIALKVGDTSVAYVVSHSHNLFMMQLTPQTRGRLHLLNASDDIEILQRSTDYFKIGTGHRVKIIGTGGKGEGFDLAIADRETSLRPGQIVPAVVLGVVNSRGLHLQLPLHQVGDAHLTDIVDSYVDHPESQYAVNQIVRCCIVSELPGVRHKWAVSLRPSRLGVGKKCKVVDREIRSLADINEGDVLRGFIVTAGSVTVGVLVSFSASIVGKVQHGKLSRYFFEDLGFVFPPGKVVTAKILSIDRPKGHLFVSLLEADTGVAENVPNEFKTCLRYLDDKPTADKEEDDKKSPVKRSGTKRKAAEDSEDAGKPVTPTAKKTKTDIAKVNSVERQSKQAGARTRPEKPHLSLSVPFSWDATFSLPSAAGNNSDSDDSGFDCQEKTDKRKKPKKGDSKEAEKKLFEAEMRLLDANHEPQSDDEFARLVLQSPNSSLCWLHYVAFKVSATDFDGARVVFDRALNTIPSTEEQECLNVWTAYLNFENMYGSQSRVDEVLKRAQLKVDPVVIQRRLCDIYAQSNKTDAAIEIYRSMLRRGKLRADINIWLGFAALLFGCSKTDDARKLYDQALHSLEPKLHVEMARKFAQLEFRHGSVERGKTLFENLITTYPRRTDIWSVYIDVCIKFGDIDQARSLFDRVTSLSLPAKRIKFLFDRYLNFENTHGTTDTINAVKSKAVSYAQSEMD